MNKKEIELLINEGFEEEANELLNREIVIILVKKIYNKEIEYDNNMYNKIILDAYMFIEEIRELILEIYGKSISNNTLMIKFDLLEKVKDNVSVIKKEIDYDFLIKNNYFYIAIDLLKEEQFSKILEEIYAHYNLKFPLYHNCEYVLNHISVVIPKYSNVANNITSITYNEEGFKELKELKDIFYPRKKDFCSLYEYEIFIEEELEERVRKELKDIICEQYLSKLNIKEVIFKETDELYEALVCLLKKKYENNSIFLKKIDEIDRDIKSVELKIENVENIIEKVREINED